MWLSYCIVRPVKGPLAPMATFWRTIGGLTMRIQASGSSSLQIFDVNKLPARDSGSLQPCSFLSNFIQEHCRAEQNVPNVHMCRR